ncbi:TraG family conjugative transposon ATPase [Chitinophaga barathri]|uniref:TraG family conjugative transposon ATPase n=1 Tax=Chitinophaga barathri TaxID=1647451 RepID=A0A3N4M7R1_9BACT|nr:TraG family conjugative transposon ATPase [Chitinophaga barathri]RPD39338.1 TraG family conjugative transposon ATPase [Chitinophaga barathri]
MEKCLSDILPIMAVENDCILSKMGDITVAFSVELPEIFSLGEDDYENLHQAWVKAIKVLPKHSVLHKQDWFTENKYSPDKSAKRSFLTERSDSYFAGRPFLDHACFIMLTKKPAQRKPVNSMFSSLIRHSIVPAETLDAEQLRNFLDVCGQFKRILEDSGMIKLTRLRDHELTSSRREFGLIERYCSLSEKKDSRLFKDISFSDDIKIGDQHLQVYSLGDVEDLPALCGSRITYEKYSTDRTKFSIGFAGSLGMLLPCNHIYNQYVFVDDSAKTIKKLESKRLRLQSLSAYSRENSISRDATNDFLNEAIGEQRMPVRAHFNVMVWGREKVELKDIKNMVTSGLAQMDAVAKLESAGAPQIFWAGIPGNAGDFPLNDSFDTFATQASCFFNQESNYRSVAPDEGFRFTDRLTGRPVFLDPYNAPRAQGVSSNMGTLVCGASGAGKSMVINHILRTLYDQGAHCVTIDIGGSYRGLCDLVDGYYFTYTETNPIRFNPFYLPDGQILDTEKKESLKSLLVALWKQENDAYNRSEYVALSNALQGYFDHLKESQEIFPSFNSFYEYLQSVYIEVLRSHNVKDKDFDVNNFLYVLRPYYRGGEFDYLLNATENLDLLNTRFVVVEVDAIKDHPVLFPVVCLLCMEMFLSKMRKLPGVRKVLTVDEAWKAIAKSGMAEFLKYAFKTIRKFNGVPIVITQELDDLISSPIIKDAIINNADVKILMDMRKFLHKFDKLQDALGLSEKEKTILLSVKKEDREIFVGIGGQIMKVLRNELCPEEYYAYTTEGRERVMVIEYAEKFGSMEKGIVELVKDKQQRA